MGLRGVSKEKRDKEPGNLPLLTITRFLLLFFICGGSFRKEVVITDQVHTDNDKKYQNLLAALL